MSISRILKREYLPLLIELIKGLNIKENLVLYALIATALPQLSFSQINQIGVELECG